jgi:hypothetical protein
MMIGGLMFILTASKQQGNQQKERPVFFSQDAPFRKGRGTSL